MHDPISLTIGEMAVRFGVSLRALRFYEARGLLHPSRCGSVRLFSSKDQIRLELILKGKRLGFTLSEIQDLIASVSEPTSLPLSKAQIESRISSLSQKREALEQSLDELRDRLKLIA